MSSRVMELFIRLDRSPVSLLETMTKLKDYFFDLVEFMWSVLFDQVKYKPGFCAVNILGDRIYCEFPQVERVSLREMIRLIERPDLRDNQIVQDQNLFFNVIRAHNFRNNGETMTIFSKDRNFEINGEEGGDSWKENIEDFLDFE